MARKPAFAVVGAACTIYGIAATACSGGHAHFLVASVMPGALLLAGALLAPRHAA